jgi:hypothetical protein
MAPRTDEVELSTEENLHLVETNPSCKIRILSLTECFLSFQAPLLPIA